MKPNNFNKIGISLGILVFSIFLSVVGLNGEEQPIQNEIWLDTHLKSTSLAEYNYEADYSLGQKKTVRFKGKQREYYYYLPKICNEQTPVIIALHGSARDGYSMIDTWAKLARDRSVIIVAPTGFNNNWSYGKEDYEFIQYCLKEVLSSQGFSLKKPCLFGHSSGGVFALLLAANYPNSFQNVAVHAAALPEKLKFSAKGKDKYKNSRVGIFLGDHDDVFSIYQAENTLKRLERTGLRVKLFIFGDHNHWYYADANKINEYIWDFFTGYY